MSDFHEVMAKAYRTFKEHSDNTDVTALRMSEEEAFRYAVYGVLADLKEKGDGSSTQVPKTAD